MAKNFIWHDGAEGFMSIQHLSQERALHPVLVERVERCTGSLLLDYGCGDGRILRRLSDRWTIDAFDPSPQMRGIVERGVGSRIRRLASSAEEVQGPYDVIVLGMVLLTIAEQDDFLRVLRNCALKMSVDSSTLFITTTHPCFRPWQFSNFTTSFGGEQPFNYMGAGVPFHVTLQDPGTEAVVFTDYHWSLDFTMNALRSQGLSVVSFSEIGDDPESPARNPLVPAFLMLECRRFE